MSSFLKTNYNPDVLTCLANLSNDEVFTPPELVNQMLDMLPAELWQNPEARFLDPVCKSGVFLREIAKRLIAGLAEQIPDLQARIDHVFTRQLYGIAITELTGLLSRRSVYCAKYANSPLSVCNGFDHEQGNIRYARIEHTWQNGKCTDCGASQEVYERSSDELENHAYAFIHGNWAQNILEVENMKFDVIIGNPPYQLSDGGAQASASPIYHKFVEQAKKLNPDYLVMIIPSRWFAGGKGLDAFRAEMLADKRMKTIVDFHDAADCFPGVEIKGGVCYFLWEKNHQGECEVVPVVSGKMQTPMARDIGKYDVFVRLNEAIPILEKVQSKNEITFDTKMSSRKPFGFPTNFKDFHTNFSDGMIKVFANNEIGYLSRNKVSVNADWIDKDKVIISKAYNGGYTYPHQIIGKPIVAEKGSCCTETYIICDVLENAEQAQNLCSYICTKFFRFMVFLRKVSQDNPKDRFAFVPVQDYNKPWTDEELYAKYDLTAEEIAFIEKMVRPMELEND